MIRGSQITIEARASSRNSEKGGRTLLSTSDSMRRVTFWTLVSMSRIWLLFDPSIHEVKGDGFGYFLDPSIHEVKGDGFG